MSLTKFDNTELTRNRLKTLNLVEANVLISKGNLSGETLPGSITDFETFLEKFENVGINGKDSPVFNDEDIIEEFDYENEVVGVKALGDIIVKKISQGYLEWISDELRNEEVTVLLVPRDYTIGDQCLFIEGIKLSKKLEGKANSEGSSQVTLSYMRRADKTTDVYQLLEIKPDL